MIEKKTIKMYIDEMKDQAKHFQNANIKSGYLEALTELWDLIESNEPVEVKEK